MAQRLDQHQLQLLRVFVEAARRGEKVRPGFSYTRQPPSASPQFEHPGLHGNPVVSMGDIEILGAGGLLTHRSIVAGKGSIQLTDEAFDAYDRLRADSAGEETRNAARAVGDLLDTERRLMTDVATGGLEIKKVNEEYKKNRETIAHALAKLGVSDPNPFKDLWDWYNRWSSGDLPTYKSRRQYLSELFAPAIDQLKSIEAGTPAAQQREPTGWTRVDRGLDKMRSQLSSAREEEDFQGVGLLGREVLISLAQAVYDDTRHRPTEGVKPSETDANRMLSGFIEKELQGQANEALRKHAKAALDLSVTLQHKRSADFRMAALCAEATASVVNIIAIVSGRRDPS